MNNFQKEFTKAALIRAIRTAAQTALSLITVGVGFGDIDWATVISVSAVATIASLLTSIATGLPETKADGVFLIDNTDPKTTHWTLQYNGDPNELKTGDSVRLQVMDAEQGGGVQ